MDRSFWKNKKVLLTGHTGFKGSWLSLWLQDAGADLIGFSLPPPTEPSLFNVAHVADGMTSHIGDIRLQDQFDRTLSEHHPEIVFHMAAQSLVRYSYDNPVETYATNVLGTVHLLDSIRRIGGVKVVVNVTSDKCYENKEWVWGYRESDSMGGFDPYSNSKGCAELVTSAFRNSFFPAHLFSHHGVALASVRAGNVIGGGDWSTDRLIPDIMKSIMEKSPILIRNPHAIRPWQHVLEPLSGYLLLAEKLWEKGSEFAEGWNFGPREEDVRPVEWIAEKLTTFWGTGVPRVLSKDAHPYEAHFLKLDSSKARTRLGWYPRWSLDMALSAIVEWYRLFVKKEDMRKKTLEQILRYENSNNERFFMS